MTQHRKEMIYVLSLAVLSLIAGIVTLIAKKMFGIAFIIGAAFMFLLFLGLKRMSPEDQTAQEKAERMGNDERNMQIVYRACHITTFVMFYVLAAGGFFFACICEIPAVGLIFGALWLFLVILYVAVKLIISKKM